MRGLLILFLLALAGPAAADDPARPVGDLYRQFVAAQNARDLDGVRELLVDGPSFLWVSDGQSTTWKPARVKFGRNREYTDGLR